MIKEISTKLNSFEIYTIFRNEDNSFILDSAMDPKKLGRYSFIGFNPFKIIKYKNTAFCCNKHRIFATFTRKSFRL